MKLKEMAVKASKGNAKMAGKLHDYLRFHYGFNYEDIWLFMHKITGISEEYWDELLYDSDLSDSD